MEHPSPRLVDRQPPDEIARQLALLDRNRLMRTALTVLTFAMSAMFVPFWIGVIGAGVDLAAEFLGITMMRRFLSTRRPAAYLGSVAAVVLAEVNFTLVAVVVFHDDNPFAKAYAAGAVTLTMLQLASLRAIHLPYALWGFLGVFTVTVAGVVNFWWGMGDSFGFIANLVAVVAAAYFMLVIMRSNHSLHDGMARGRAAAQAADEAKSRFLAQMSHELRTPLNAILGLGHAELHEARDEAARQRMTLLVTSARSLGVILDDVLDLSAIQAGRLPIRPTTANPGAELQAVVALFHPLFAAEGQSLTLSLPDDLPPLARFDAQRLRQCLSNLLSNALKYTETGGASVAVQWLPENLLRIEVSDTGPGITAAEAEDLFAPFHRGSAAQPGSGLGLSIARDLARAMGGDVQLLPSPSGARFGLTIALPPATAQDAAPPPPDLPADIGHRRILVVDDIGTNRLVALAHLRLFGLLGDEASSGEAALELLAAAPYDLVLLDMHMPGLDGVATLQRIRQLPGAMARVPVVAMTADATEAHRRQYLAAGMDGYLAKPLTPEAMRDILRQHLPR